MAISGVPKSKIRRVFIFRKNDTIFSMKIHDEIFEKVSRSGAKILVVTKYFDAKISQKIYEKISKKPEVFGLGENRAEFLEEKNLPREFCNFIGKIQSRKIPKIAKFCSKIHSIEKIEHAVKFLKLDPSIKFFVQVNISRDPAKSGILPENFADFWQKFTKKVPKSAILGISAMGAGKFSVAEKVAEFRELKSIRDRFCPQKSVSAGTSRDFEIALKEKIEVVRVGKAVFDA